MKFKIFLNNIKKRNIEDINYTNITKLVKNNKNIFIVGIVLLFLISIHSGLHRIVNSDFWPIDGDFQNYNVWRRLLAGQIPFKDFVIYLGFGHLILGSFFTFIFGNNFTASLFTSNFLTSIFSIIIIYEMSYLILRKKQSALIITIIICTINIIRPKVAMNILPQDFLVGLDAMYSPLNSARIIRSGVVPIIIAIINILSSFRFNTRIRKKIYFIWIASLSGIGILFSNDYGISSYLALSIVFLLILIKIYKKNILLILKFIIYYIFISFFAFFLALFILTKGNIISWFNYTLGVSNYQSWYYGISISDKALYISQMNFSPIFFFAIWFIFYNIYKMILLQKPLKIAQYKKENRFKMLNY